MVLRRIYLFIFFLTTLLSFGSKDSTLFFNEFSFSGNTTSRGLNGFGFGFYHTFKAVETPKLELRFGLEYNFNKIAYEGNDGQTKYSSHVASLNYLTLPILLRENIGKKWKFFFEEGVFIDGFIDGRDVADFNYFKPNSNFTGYVDTTYRTNGHLEARSINYGVSLGTGLTFPIKKFEITCKFDAKLALSSINGNTFKNNAFIRFSVILKLPKLPWKKKSL
ncbi:MAG: hypothetical protein ACXVC2_12820 [Bacteroidia bacterium]